MHLQARLNAVSKLYTKSGQVVIFPTRSMKWGHFAETLVPNYFWPLTCSNKTFGTPDRCDSGTAPVSLGRRQKLRSPNRTEKTIGCSRSKHSWQGMPWFLNIDISHRFFRLAGVWGSSCSSWDVRNRNQSRNWVNWTSQAPMLCLLLRSFPPVFFLVVASQFPNSAASGTWKQMPTCNLYKWSQWAAQLPRLGTLFLVLCLLPLANIGYTWLHKVTLVTSLFRWELAGSCDFKKKCIRWFWRWIFGVGYLTPSEVTSRAKSLTAFLKSCVEATNTSWKWA